MTGTTTYPTAEGERRKLNAFAVLEAHREILINRGRRALLAAMLSGDETATADDVRAAVELPEGINPNLFGSVPGLLARAGIIRLARLRLSARPERHAGLNRVWELADRPAALAWLHDHPDRPDPEPPDVGDGGLFDFTTNKMPGAGTPGKYERH